MNADLTFNSIVFNKRFDAKGESERGSVTRGINTPDLLRIQSQDYIDSATKVPGQRFTARVERVAIDATTGTKYNTSMHFVISVPGLASSTDVNTVIATFKAAVADADFVADVVAGEK